MNRPELDAISFQAASIIKTGLQRGHCQPALAVTTDGRNGGMFHCFGPTLRRRAEEYTAFSTFYAVFVF
jgi:hypothetical protein